MEVNRERIMRAVLHRFGMENEVLHLNRSKGFNAFGDATQKRRNIVLTWAGRVGLREVLSGPMFRFHIHHVDFESSVPSCDQRHV